MPVWLVHRGQGTEVLAWKVASFEILAATAGHVEIEGVNNSVTSCMHKDSEQILLVLKFAYYERKLCAWLINWLYYIQQKHASACWSVIKCLFFEALPDSFTTVMNLIIAEALSIVIVRLVFTSPGNNFWSPFLYSFTTACFLTTAFLLELLYLHLLSKVVPWVQSAEFIPALVKK